MSGRALVGVVVLAVLAVSNTITVAQTAPKLDYEFFKSRVEPVFLTKRPDHARCYVCHVESNNAFRLERLSRGARFWTEEQSRRNFEVVSTLVNPGDPDTSRLLLHPLGPEGGGDGGTAVPVEARSSLAHSRRVGQWSDARFSEEIAAEPGPPGMFSVFMRLGTSPTGITAISFIDVVSIAETERRPAFEI